MAWNARRAMLPARLALVVGVLVLQAGCEQVEVTTVDVARVELEPLVATVGVQQTIRLSATVFSDGGQVLSGRNVEWTSLNPDIATVDIGGTVTGMAPGIATIRAASEGVTATASVTVSASPVIGLAPLTVDFVAVQNGASPGDRTVSVSNAGGGTLGSLTTGIRYTAGQAGWLSASMSGSTAPAALLLSVNQGSLAPGTYTAAVDVVSPEASNSPAAVTVTLTVVGPQPAIALGATAASFAAAEGGANPNQQSIGVTNAGGGSLTGLSAAVDYTAGQPAGWLSAALTGTTAPTTLVLQPATGELAAGTYTANVRISSDVAQNSPQTVSVSFTVGAAEPIIDVSPGQLTFLGQAGGASPAAQTVDIVNAGGGTLSGLALAVAYPGGQPAGWLTTSLSGTTAPAVLTVTANIGSLQAGTYNATVLVSSGVASNSPQLVQVTFEVGAAAPSIALGATTVSFTASTGSGDPTPAQISVTNSGGGSLTGLSTSISYTASQPTGWLSTQLSGTSAPATLTLSAARGSLGAGTYTATVIVSADVADNSPVGVAVTFTVTETASTPPAAPSGLSATAVSDRRIDLAWTDNSTDESGFSIERSSDAGGSWSLLSTTAPNQTTYTDASGLAGGTSYTYRVSACNAAGCTAAASTATATTAPEAPSGLSASAPSATQVDLAWSDNSTDETGFEVERSTNGGQSWSNLHTAAAGTTTFTDTGVSAGTSYDYRVRACRDSVCSRYSNQASVTTPSLVAPAAPTGFSATGVSASRIDLAWSHDGLLLVTGFEIERAPGDDPGAFAAIATAGAADRSYADTGLPAGTSFLYRIRACNAVGCSAWVEAGASTQQDETAPATPTNVDATPISATEVIVSWTPPGGQTHYEIRRRSGQGGPWTFSDVVAGDATSYHDTGLSPNSTYQYQVAACASACSEFSSAVTARTLADGSDGDTGASTGSIAGTSVMSGYLAGTRKNEYSSLMSSATLSTDATRGFCISNCSNVNDVRASPRNAPSSLVAVTSHTTGRVTPRSVRSPTSWNVISPEAGSGS
jgi:hypothetical protein